MQCLRLSLTYAARIRPCKNDYFFFTLACTFSLLLPLLLLLLLHVLPFRRGIYAPSPSHIDSPTWPSTSGLRPLSEPKNLRIQPRRAKTPEPNSALDGIFEQKDIPVRHLNEHAVRPLGQRQQLPETE